MSFTPEFQSRLDVLCPAYLQFLAEHDREIFLSDVVVLYGRDCIEERNTTNEVAEYLPDYVSIGNDSGDYELLLRRDGSEIVVWEDPGCFSAPSLEMIHSSFPKWLAEGCPLPEAPECPIPLRGNIWLLTAPFGGMKDMFGLKKVLALDWSVPQMKQILERLPALLIEQGHPFGVHRTLLEHRAFRPLLGFSAPDSDVIHPYTDFDENCGVPIPQT